MGILISILFWCMPEKKHLNKISAVFAAWEIFLAVGSIILFNVSIFILLGLILIYLPISIINLIMSNK